MKNDLFTTLKGLKNIQPDSEYSNNSRNFILSQTQISADLNTDLRGFKNWFDLKHSLMLAGALASFIFIVLIAVSYLPGNKNSLVAEANEINASIQVKLDEIGYQLDNQKIDFSMASNIQNILKTTVDELAQAQEELKNNPDKLKESVKKIKKAEQDIAKINELLQNK